MTRRIVAITVAIVLAALGTIGGLFLVVTADDRARDAINDAVVVAVATKRIPAGTTGTLVRTESLVRFEKMPRVSVPSDALTELTEDLDRKVITSNIAAGQILMRANFGEQSQVTSGLPLPEGKMAVTVQTGAPEQVAGYVQPSSQVAIFLTYTVVNANGSRSSIERTRLLLPRVEVLAVGTYQDTDGDDAREPRTTSLLVTVAVTQPEAERLIEGLSHGTLYLGLLTESTPVRPGPGVDNTDADGDSSSLF
jgi:pilus assembly protein CpaB